MEQAQAGVELTRAYAGRPAFVSYKGGRVALSIRDGAYLLERRAWRQRLAAAHPDKGGTATRFEKLKRQYDAWEAAQRRGFAELGWPVPRASDGQASATHDAPAADLPVRVWRSGDTARRRIHAFMIANPDASADDVVSALGVKRHSVHQTRSAARKGQLHVKTTPAQRAAAVLRDGLLHSVEELAAAIRSTNAKVRKTIYHLRRRHGLRVARITIDHRQTYYQLLGSFERHDV